MSANNCHRSTLRDLAVALNRSNVVDLCYAYIRGLHWVGEVVAGVNSVEQLDEIAEALSSPALTSVEVPTSLPLESYRHVD